MQKLARGRFPAERSAVARARPALAVTRRVDRPFERVRHGAHFLIQNIKRPWHRESGHRRAASQGFDHDQAERVGLARKDKNVSPRIKTGQFAPGALAQTEADEYENQPRRL